MTAIKLSTNLIVTSTPSQQKTDKFVKMWFKIRPSLMECTKHQNQLNKSPNLQVLMVSIETVKMILSIICLLHLMTANLKVK